MALPQGTTGSLSPTFVPARPVCLAVKPACAFALDARFPTVLSGPLGASVTFWEATAPVKLPTCHGPASRSGSTVRPPVNQGWYPKVGSPHPNEHGSQPPTYPVHDSPAANDRLE